MKDGLREIVIDAAGGTVMICETDNPDGADVIPSNATVHLDSTQLRFLGDKIVGWFDDGDDREALRKKLSSVLEQNEARCLDDDVDRGVVLGELMKALSR